MIDYEGMNERYRTAGQREHGGVIGWVGSSGWDGLLLLQHGSGWGDGKRRQSPVISRYPDMIAFEL